MPAPKVVVTKPAQTGSSNQTRPQSSGGSAIFGGVVGVDTVPGPGQPGISPNDNAGHLLDASIDGICREHPQADIVAQNFVNLSALLIIATTYLGDESVDFAGQPFDESYMMGSVITPRTNKIMQFDASINASMEIEDNMTNPNSAHGRIL